MRGKGPLLSKLPRATAMRPLSRRGKRKLMDFQAGALPQSISTPRKESGSLCPYVACVATHRGVSIGAKNVPERGGSLLGARVRHSTHGKGHEEGVSTYAKAGSSLRSPPGNPRASTPITRACLLYYFVLQSRCSVVTYTSDFTGGCPPPPLSEKELT